MIRRSRRLVSALFLASASLIACSSGSSTHESVSRTGEAVIHGTTSDASQDAVVLLVHYDPAEPMGVGECSGTLLSPKLVLTARHCVAKTDESAACTAAGDPVSEGKVYQDYKASSLYVFTGNKRPDFYAGSVDPAGKGAQILRDSGKSLCNHDIALILLDAEIPNAKIAPVRLDSEPAKGDAITSVGWGLTENGEASTRQERKGVKILTVGPGTDTPPNEFVVGESIGSGDSGGPALAESGAVLGVVSRGGNGTAPTQSDPAAGCIDAENIYTKVAPFKDLILSAYAAAGQDPWLEGGPDPRLAKFGETCESDDQCRSSLCVSEKSGKVCGQSCADDPKSCPDGYQCDAKTTVCALPPPPTTTTSGCSASPVRASGWSGALVGLALAIARLRRRSRG